MPPTQCTLRRSRLRRRRPRAAPSVLAALLAACTQAGSEGRPGPESPPPLPAVVVEAPAPRPLPQPDPWVERTLAGMSLRQRVAQLVFPWITGAPSGATPGEAGRLARWTEREEVGGLIVSRGAPAAVAAKLNAAQARSRVPLLVVSDLETGPGMRLSPGGTPFPPAMAFGAAGDVELAREAGRVTGAEARAVGIHATLGPVLDVNSNPRNPIINVRSFGEDPQRVARLASAWIAGAREAGLLTVGKHFPGHGDTGVDSHVGLPSITADSARLARVELPPFRGAIRSGMDGVLVGHIAVVGLEGPGAPPASLSPRIIGGMLRGDLGFEGLVFTDALNMGGVTRRHSVPEASIRALLAGADVLLQPPGEGEVIDAVVAAVESGRIPRERVDEAARRVLAAKARAGLHRGARVDPAALDGVVGSPEHLRAARRTAAASITLVRDRGGLVPLPAAARSILHVTYAPEGSSAGGGLTAALSAAGRQVSEVRLSGRATAAQLASLRARAASADLVLASAFVTPREYRELALPPEFGAFVEGLAAAGKPVVAVSLGSPYVLGAFPSVPAYLAAWTAASASQRAAADALLGRAPITGRLPVALPPYHVAGAGVDRPGPDAAD
ncbi:MAG TPA: glycoside hydrolase family 3 N-terminal domain-containing protein [Longimicrobiaceae bacterium]|nr:glycoside hydrolase family 3 N-terminal domain-containing protein [Longimicrobiaceae bacterium]